MRTSTLGMILGLIVVCIFLKVNSMEWRHLFSLQKQVSYGDVVKHGRRLAYNFSTASSHQLPGKAGNFSDPAMWGNGNIPNSNTTDIIYIPAGTNLTLDQDAYFRVWIIEGRLDFSTLRDITCKLNLY